MTCISIPLRGLLVRMLRNDKKKTCGISVVVPMYNSCDHIKACLDSLICQTYTDFEIILVDDCSTDATVARVEKFVAAHPDLVRLISRNENGGPPVARNQAVREARFDYLGTVDADSVVARNWLETASLYFEEGEVFGGGYVARPTIDFERAVWMLQVFPAKKRTFTLRDVVPKIAGTNTFFTRRAFEEIGGYNEKLLGIADRLFLMQAIKNGYSVIYYPDLIVYHPCKKTFKAYFRQENIFRKRNVDTLSIIQRKKYRLIPLASVIFVTAFVLSFYMNRVMEFGFCVCICLFGIFCFKWLKVKYGKGVSSKVALIASALTFVNYALTLKHYFSFRKGGPVRYWR